MASKPGKDRHRARANHPLPAAHSPLRARGPFGPAPGRLSASVCARGTSVGGAVFSGLTEVGHGVRGGGAGVTQVRRVTLHRSPQLHQQRKRLQARH